MTAADGARELLEAYRRANLYAGEQFESDRFIRLKHLQLLLENGDLGADLRRRTGCGTRSRMIFTETERLKDAYLVDVEPRTDERGFFARAGSKTSSPRPD